MFFIKPKHGGDGTVYRVLSVENYHSLNNGDIKGKTKFLIFRGENFEWVYADFYRLVEVQDG